MISGKCGANETKQIASSTKDGDGERDFSSAAAFEKLYMDMC